ncbi:MAG: LytR C-terminal domain-containing protein [Melioribacteraceae bacterium]|nr:LytR C-terminal domain-containing protein [Melioribacteraceae bacterium]MCF8266349.1 LytR C-terminal domain-containing protein [Melioribacteraceae bacterium]MCF8431944.1 LytR C-terminal domain-containing protein [Melioribacteraceae bacterium]
MASKTTNTSKNSTIRNLFLNVIIFLLASLIIYLSFSIYIKLSGKESVNLPPKEYKTPSEIIQAEVLNGCGVTGIADRFTDYLRNKGVDIVNTDNYYRFDISKSMVIDRTGRMANAYEVAKVLGISEKNVVQLINEDYFLDVSVVIGKDYHNLKPIK